ncbi:MAG: hypothetical protein A3C06_03865 [Candidatus Taylorbacteria bacterium RIFCSPHIGHO2_02_FULL_46_13]|uniref:TVP38/TMEM64 family membrane protein n=1 Tax=Candidatus Taylorbacteria bacterium RIFCSPHIGHO2_02_FULL_46_13 TaxID=1802312 RepID=A0A1G2MQI7_9BACT|nr:MAG: hypothetical protein A3C06_03865 [Candidatus Taylorbacteria bacterium RIFCSPHIGHO2_02_FULL_46_13]
MSEEINFLGGQKPSWRDAAKNLLFIAIAIGVAYWVTVEVGIDDVRASVAHAGVYAPLIIILLKATTLVVVPLGGTPLYPIAGALFGFWQGLGITLIGDILGSSIAFYLSRYFGRSILRFFMSSGQVPMVERLMEKMGERKTFIKAKLFFAGFPEIFAYAAGLTAVSFPFFLLVHIGVHAVGAALLVLFGEALVSGNTLAFIGVGIVSALLAFSGIWWFHADLKRSA